MADASDWSAAQASALAWLEANFAALSADHMTIWDFARAVLARIPVGRLVRGPPGAEGFAVEARLGRHADRLLRPLVERRRPGARRLRRIRRRARAEPGAGALPQAARGRQHRCAAGHTDPHSALGMGSLGGFLAAKHAMEKHGIGGTLVFFGEPAEKMCGSKPVHAAHGYYDGLDAAISFHPHSFAGADQRLLLGHAAAPPTGAGSTPSSARTRRPGRARRARRLGDTCPCHGARARRHRRRLPDVHELQDA